MFAPMYLKQYHSHHPAKGYSLNLIFSNLALDVTEAETVNFDKIVYNFKMVNVQGISKALKNLDWEADFADNDVVDNVSKFYQDLNETVKANVSLKRLKVCHFPP